jgi:beta-N-acetylhexosaminidase
MANMVSKTRRLLLLATIAIFFMAQYAPVAAISDSQLKIFQNKIYYFDADQSSCTTPTTPASGSSSLSIPSDFSLKQKVAQMLMVGVSDKSEAVDLEKNYQIGGFLLNSSGSSFGFSKSDIDDIRQAGQLPAIFAIDEEGGEVDRLGAGIPSAKAMGSMSDDQVKQQGADVGKKMSDLGITVDFAPVLDLDNGSNQAISVPGRSFSADPNTVAKKAGAFAAGLESAKIVPTFKHFPGLGNATGSTDGNTDTGSATTPNISSLKNNDLKPYAALLKGDSATSAVMVGNQVVPGLTNGQPASLSKAAYDLLYNDYSFNQVAFTDELANAVAIKDSGHSPEEAVLAAIKAGADMPLFNSSDESQVSSIIDYVAQAAQSDPTLQTQIGGSLQKIIALKNGASIANPAPTPGCCDAGSPTPSSDTPVSGDIQSLAQQVLSNSNITFDYGPSGPTGSQFKRLANGQKAETDDGRQVDVEPILLVAILHLAQSHKVQLSALTDGSSHTAPTNPHGAGKAVDVDYLDSTGTNGSDSTANTIINNLAQVLPDHSRFGMGNNPFGTKQIDGKTFSSFTDNPNHVHFDVLGVSQSADDQAVSDAGSAGASTTAPTDGGSCGSIGGNGVVCQGLQDYSEGSDSLKQLFANAGAKTGVPAAGLAAQSYQEAGTYWDKSTYSDSYVTAHAYLSGGTLLPQSQWEVNGIGATGPMQLNQYPDTSTDPGFPNKAGDMVNFKQQWGQDYPVHGEVYFDSAIYVAAIIDVRIATGQGHTGNLSLNDMVAALQVYGTLAGVPASVIQAYQTRFNQFNQGC